MIWFRRFNGLFVLWVVLFSAVAYLVPPSFAWFRPFIVPGLGVIMLGMGLTLLPEDFRRLVHRLPAVAAGVAAQFGVMPLGGLLAAEALGLDGQIRLGVLLVTVCPGGTASNVIAYLAGADVALSITMTAASTLLSPLLTPGLLYLYAGESVRVSFASQAAEIARVIVLPVVIGVGGRLVFERTGRRRMVERMLDVFPSISVLFITLIVASIVALNAERIGELGPAVAAAVLLTNAFGLAGGYALARALRFDTITARTLAIEVGMQNSGLGVALASQFFTLTAALPAAFFSLWHNITGPALASYWSRRPAPVPPAR